ncbi:hypothetical protein EYW49_02270 [Siculibacillus lacustris]|uniref:DUF2336 domain-containing protein n=1 Tax=Siculibacillus lacustris TaxID=1549641 RepID=A0A4Q9VYB7_9HYPH|nr:hypothetical protein [Siculibacillus lacustris]TBW41002.1 hypothetical protein EYW49_02270 [Siculibacillus lacustris]
MPHSTDDPIAPSSPPPTSTTSASVLRNAVDLFVRDPSHEKAEIRTFADLVGGLLDDVGLEDRCEVSNRLAGRADLLPALARRLAMDDPRVAAPMVVRSPVLTSADLVQIMRCGPGHVRLVAERLDLAPDVAASLTRPMPFDLAPSEARPRPHATEPVAAAIVVPAAEPPTASPSRSATEARAEPRVTSVATFLALDPATRWRAIQDGATAAALGAAPSRSRRKAVEAIGPRLFAALVIHDRLAFRDDLAAALRLDVDDVARILADPHGEALAVCLAALGIDERSATSILLLHTGEHATLGQMQDLSSLTARIGWRTAEHLLGQWRGVAATRGEAQRVLDPAERRDDRRETAVPRREATRETTPRRLGAE